MPSAKTPTAVPTTERIAVLICAYNAQETLRKTVDSVLAQTVECDVLVVDDGSKVPVSETLTNMPRRVRILRLPENRRLVHATNEGLAELLKDDYAYIARCDADDSWQRDKLEKQVVYLAGHPKVMMVGSWATFYTPEGVKLKSHRTPTTAAGIKRAMWANSCFIHSSVLMRTEAVRRIGLYHPAFEVGLDYEYVRRMAHFFPTANLPEELVDYVVMPNGLTVKKWRRQLWSRFRVQILYFDWRQPLAWRGLGQTLLTAILPQAWFNKLKRLLNK